MPRKFDFVSPGVLISEIDESRIPDVVSDDVGPLIIGRALSGPAMKPIKVKTLDDFNTIFGKGISGKGGKDNDIWREGNSLGPTYGIYAAQAHLASQTTPVTFVRLLGEADASADSNAESAGWSVSTSANPNKLPASTNTAYGLFIIPSASYDDADNIGSGSLAAVFYTKGAALTLSGTIAGTTSDATSSAGTLIKSLGGAANKFKMCLYTANDKMTTESGAAAAAEFTFDLTPGSKDYIRDVFNTNPQLLQANKNFGLTDQNYFLGETYEVAVAGNTSTSVGAQQAILVALDSGSLNWSDHYKDMLPAKSGWFINRQPTQEKLFRVVALHDGEWLQNNYHINIRDLALGNTLSPNSTFTLEVAKKNGDVVEQYSGLNLDPSSESYIAKIIGDQYLEWDSTNAKYNVRGEYANNSDYIYIEISEALKAGLSDRHALPVGFYGPLRPKGFTLLHASKGVQNLNDIDGNGTAANGTIIIGGTPAEKSAIANDETLTVSINGEDNIITFKSSSAASLNQTTFTANAATVNVFFSSSAEVGAHVNTLINSHHLLTSTLSNNTASIKASYLGSSQVLAFTDGTAGDVTLSSITAGTDTDDFAHSFVLGNEVLACHGGDAETFANLPLKYSASVTFPSLRLTEENSNSNGKNFAASALQGVRHHKGTSIHRDDSYNDIIRVLPTNASNTLTHHLGEGEALPDSLEYSFIFTMDDICSGSAARTNEFYHRSGSHETAVNSQLSVAKELGLSKLLEKKVKQFSAPLFGGHDGLDLTEVEQFSNKNLADKTRLSSYAYNSIFKAIESISDAESVNYDLISIPGLTNTDITDEVLSLASTRQDCLAIIDIPGGYKPGYENNGTVTTGDINGTITNLEGRLINNSYAATYYPWVRLRDRVGGSGDILFAPPSVAAIGALGKSQGMSELWFAPAGFNRGGINELGGPEGPIITGTWEHLTKDDRDRLYQTNINPIARFPSLNQIVIFGQKTLQQTSSALDRINVRRLLIYLKYRIGLVSNTILFDQNVKTTWRRFKFQADRILADTQSRLGISEYKLVLDDSTTTADYVDRNIMYAKIFIKPTRSVEFIAVDFVISRSGVQF